MKLLLQHIQLKLKQSFRQPYYLVSTLVFPSVFFLFFALPNIKTSHGANLMLASFSAYAFIGVVFFQFGIDTSHEKASQWAIFLKTLPIKLRTLFLAKSFSAILLALLSTFLLSAVVYATTPLDVSIIQYFRLISVLLVASLPFCLMGLTIGYFIPSNSVLPITNLLYILLSFVGGLWMPPNALPESVKRVSEYLPTRFYGEMVWAQVTDLEFHNKYLIGLILYFVLFLITAFLGYRKKTMS